MGRLTNQVLSHAMVIHRSEAVMFERVDLVAVARRALAEGVPLSLERSLHVDFNAPAEPVWILGDPVSLREAITNLVNNAVQHGAPMRLVVTVGGDETRRWVEVADNRPGIPPSDWLTVRKPFERLKQSSKTIGSGLGLAIVDDVAKAHDGAVSFRLGETDAAGSTGLFTVTLSFPASAQPTSVATAGVVTAMSSGPMIARHLSPALFTSPHHSSPWLSCLRREKAEKRSGSQHRRRGEMSFSPSTQPPTLMLSNR